jgi:hypothetical protein
MNGPPPESLLNTCQIQYHLRHYWTHYSERMNWILSSLYFLVPEKKRNGMGHRQFDTYYQFGFLPNRSSTRGTTTLLDKLSCPMECNLACRIRAATTTRGGVKAGGIGCFTGRDRW